MNPSPCRNGLARDTQVLRSATVIAGKPAPTAVDRLRCFAAVGLILALVSGCSALQPKATPQPAYYSLDSGKIEPRSDATLPPTALTLIVNPPHAASGFDSQRILYVRTDHQLEYFAHSEWVDTPARMLAPLIVSAVERSGAYRAVVLTPSAAAGDLRLDSEIVRLQHEFGGQPSSVRFTLRAYIVDNSTRRVQAWREFDATEPSASDDPYGGVIAANRAVQKVLQKLADFCAETARQRK
jgi:cholesterol transport system auxiliary component